MDLFELPAAPVVEIKYRGPLAGLVIVARRAGRNAVVAADRLGRQVNGEDISVEDEVAMRALFELFERALIEWNASQDGDPLPATPGGFRSIRDDVALDIVLMWILSYEAPDANDDRPDPSESALPMETLAEV